MSFQKNNLNHAITQQRGAIIVMAAIFLIPMIAMAALAIDINNISIARNELQNAADAAALAGGNCFYPSGVTGCTATGGNPIPDLTAASNRATNAVGTSSITGLNKVANTSLTTATVTKGYWNITGTPTGLHSTSSGSNDLPAIKVTINKTSASNGAINTLFAGIFGTTSVDGSATAVAVVSSPNTTTANLFPLAISQCMYDTYWNSSTNQPTGIGASGFNIFSSYGGNGQNNGGEGNEGNGQNNGSSCSAGQWSSLNSSSNSDQTVQTLLQYANGSLSPPSTATYTTGSSTVHISTGAMTNLYSSNSQNQPNVNACSAAGDGSCDYVIVAVVPGITSNSNQAINGFACLHILSATGGNNKAINVQMVAPGNPNCIFPSSGVGPTYGVTAPPSLVNYSGNTY